VRPGSPARSGKPFFELQVEVCQRGLEELPNVTGISKDAEDDCRSRLTAEIDQLRRSKAGIFVGCNAPADRLKFCRTEQQTG
jgi:hypothetical protein